MGTNDSVTFFKCLNWVLCGNLDQKKIVSRFMWGEVYFIWKPHQRKWSLLEWKSIVLKKTRESVNEHTHPKITFFFIQYVSREQINSSIYEANQKNSKGTIHTVL